MSQEQYNALLSNLLREKRALAKLRVELEGRKGKLCRSYKGFRHLARNCRNKNEEGKGVTTPQNKFEVLSSRVMQCGIEGKIVRSMRTAGVKCFKCGEEGHKCRTCPKKEKRVARPAKGKVHQGERREVRRVEEKEVARVAMPQKAQQEKKPVRPVKGEAQKGEKRVRRIEEEKAARPTREEAQQEWRRSSWEELRKRAEWYCGPTVPQDAQLWELGWRGQGAVVTYLKCPRCGRGGCYAEDDRGQGTLSY